MGTDHDAEAEAEGAREEGAVAVYAKVLLAGEAADDEVDAYHRRAEDACWKEGVSTSRHGGLRGAEAGDLPAPLTKHMIHPRVSLPVPGSMLCRRYSRAL